MSAPNLRALVIDADPGVLADVVRVLAPKGFHVATRLSPDDALDYVRRSKPNVVLLGVPYWDQGWGAKVVAASPGTVVVPAPRTADAAA